MVFAMSKSNLVAFRIPSELQDEFNRSVLASGGDKTSWLVDAIRMKLGQPEKSIDSRMLGLVERMEKAAASLIAGKLKNWSQKGYTGELPHDGQKS
jgi:hypothetical protein